MKSKIKYIVILLLAVLMVLVVYKFTFKSGKDYLYDYLDYYYHEFGSFLSDYNDNAIDNQFTTMGREYVITLENKNDSKTNLKKLDTIKNSSITLNFDSIFNKELALLNLKVDNKLNYIYYIDKEKSILDINDGSKYSLDNNLSNLFKSLLFMNEYAIENNVYPIAKAIDDNINNTTETKEKVIIDGKKYTAYTINYKPFELNEETVNDLKVVVYKKFGVYDPKKIEVFRGEKELYEFNFNGTKITGFLTLFGYKVNYTYEDKVIGININNKYDFKISGLLEDVINVDGNIILDDNTIVYIKFANIIEEKEDFSAKGLIKMNITSNNPEYNIPYDIIAKYKKDELKEMTKYNSTNYTEYNNLQDDNKDKLISKIKNDLNNYLPINIK